MSMVTSATALPMRLTIVFSGVGARKYGRAARTSSTSFGGLAVRPLRTGLPTRRSYLPQGVDHGVGPMVERVAGNDAGA